MTPRVLIAGGTLVPEQMAIWREVAALGVDLHVGGSLVLPSGAGDWWKPRAPDWCESHVLRPIRLRRGSMTWWVYPELGSVIRRVRPTLVHLRGEVWGLPAAQALATGRSVIAHGADNMFTHGPPLQVKLRLAMARRALGRLSGYVSWNSAGLVLATRYGLPHAVPTLVAPAELADPKPILEAAKRRLESTQSSRRTVGFVGRLDHQKGVGWLIEALGAVNVENLLFVVHGSGPMEQELIRLAGEFGVAAEFRGALHPAAIGPAFAEMDVVVVPSVTTAYLTEQFGRVAVEAMMAQAAVVVSSSGALPEVVDGGGLVVPEGDVRTLAVELERLLLDDDRRLSIALRGQRVALERYDPRVLARQFVDLWRRATGGWSGRAGDQGGRWMSP